MLIGLTACASVFDRGSRSAQRQVLQYGGVERSFAIHVPNAVKDNTQRVPLVLVIHGGGGNARHAERVSGFSDKADREGFIVVYPEGTGRLKRNLLTWNAGHCCGTAMEKGVDDVGFFNALLDKLLQQYPIDPNRVYATGISNGGMMSHRLGRELSDRFAAIAPVAAALFGDEVQPPNPVSAIMINGLLDRAVPIDGGAPGGRFPQAWDGTPARPAVEQAKFWARANGCDAESARAEKALYTLTTYRCPVGRGVQLYVIKDGGHAWPGGEKGTPRGDQPSMAINATDVIWDFFAIHSR